MQETLSAAGFPALGGVPESQRRFPDGSRWKIEIPSCEGPRVMRAVVETATELDVPVHRISQGSGVMMLSDEEIQEMLELGERHGIEVNLFLGPRAAWDTGAQARVTTAVGGAARGNAQVAACLTEAERACRLGVRSLLVGDLGVLDLLARRKAAGDLPADLVLKTSVVMPLTNAPTAAIYERLGATSLNVSTDLSVAMLAEMRAATSVPLDIYVEAPDDQGGVVRPYEIAEMARAMAPVYLKFGVRNAPVLYPVGQHLAATAEALGRERVRRAALALRLMRELDPALLD